MRSTRLPLVVLFVVAAVAVVACSGSSKEASTTTQKLSGEAAAGEQAVRDLGCTTCHTVDGSDGVGPTFQGLAGSKVELEGGETVTADQAYLTESIEDPAAKVVEGFRPVMPQRKLSESEVSSIVAYLQTLK